MIRHSAAFARAALGPHESITRVDVLSPSGRVLENDLPVVGGSVTSSRSSDVCRSVSGLTVVPGLAPPGVVPKVLRARTGNELRVWKGIGWPLPAPEMLCLGTFGIWDSQADLATGTVALNGYDRLKRVARARFPFLRRGDSLSVLSNLQILWGEAIPWARDVTVRPDVVDIVSLTLPTWQQDRLGAMKDMATSLASELLVQPFGDLVVQTIPDPQGAPDFTISTGDDSALLAATVSETQDGVFNGIVVTGASAGTTAVQSRLVVDSNPLSPTFWDAAGFGEVPGFVTLSYLQTADQATLAALGQLRNVLGVASTVTGSLLGNPAYSAGDIAGLYLPAGYEQHILDTVTHGLGQGDPTTFDTRLTQEVTVS